MTRKIRSPSVFFSTGRIKFCFHWDAVGTFVSRLGEDETQPHCQTMGRADLARHRQSVPSDTRAVTLPTSARAALAQCRASPESDAARAVLSIVAAPSQRAQVAAIKMLGVALRRAHPTGAHERACGAECACKVAGPVLAALLLDAPDSTPGVVGGALRAVLGCAYMGVSTLWVRIGDCLDRIDMAGSGFGDVGVDIEAGLFSVCDSQDCARVVRLVGDVRACGAFLSEDESRGWVCGGPERYLGVLNMICVVTRLFLAEASEECRMSSKGVGLRSGRFDGLTRAFLDGGCDAAMKAAQDVLHALLERRVLEKCEAGLAVRVLDTVRETMDLCSEILQVSSSPRNCIVAGAVVIVTATSLRGGSAATGLDLAQVLHENILQMSVEYPAFAQLALLRAAMEAPAAQSAAPWLLFGTTADVGNDETGDAHESSIFQRLAALSTRNADVHLRFLAMDALINCVRRCTPYKLSPECRDIVISLIYERWQEPFPGISAQMRSAVEALVATDGGDDESDSFWVVMVRSLVRGDWRSKGMYAPLGALVSRVGARRILELEPNAQSKAMYAASLESTLGKPVGDWLENLWRTLRREISTEGAEFAELTCEPVVSALIDDERPVLRERVAEYVLPAYFRAAGSAGTEPAAFALLGCLGESRDSISISAFTRGSVGIMSAARRHGCFVGSFTDPDTVALLQRALQSGDEDIRSSAMNLIVTCRVSTEPVLQEELDLVLAAIPSALLPSGSPSDRSRFRHSFRRFFERLESCRKAASVGSGGWWMRERKNNHGGKRSAEFEEKRLAFLARISAFVRDCAELLLGSICPGATFGRRTSALELLSLMAKNIGFEGLQGLPSSSPEAVVAALIACIVDEWERPRSAALSALSQFPSPLPGLDTLQKSRDLQMYALPLIRSPRQREADAGSLLCRLLFRKHALAQDDQTGRQERYSLRFMQSANDVEPVFSSSALTYAHSVIDAIERLASKGDENLTVACRSGLFHGEILVLRYVLEDLAWGELCVSEEGWNDARAFSTRVLNCLKRCIEVGIRGVAFEAISAAPGEEQCSIMTKDERQRVVTSCFLSCKEACIAFGILAHKAPLQDTAISGSTVQGVLSLDDMTCICGTLDHIMRNTRHWGCIDGAAEGLQLVCEALLGSSNMAMRALPQVWAFAAVSSAIKGDLYVLRRSAGIPAFILAVVNAEASLRTRSHDTPLLSGIVEALLSHLEGSDLCVADPGALINVTRSRHEDSVAHALNLLRALFLNGNVATPVLRYLERTFIITVKSFRSASWLIRNSAMMLYAALIRRGVGVCAENKKAPAATSFSAGSGTSATMDGDRRISGATAFQFFSRHPKLHPFLLSELQQGVEALRNGDEKEHPTLYPVLYLLSSLAPSAGEDPSVELSMIRFRALLNDCLYWRSDYVRRAAAAAAVPLIEDPSRVASILAECVLQKLPPKPGNITLCLEQTAATSDPHLSLSKVENGCARLQQNQLHGELLHIGSVLKGMRSLMSLQDKIEAVKHLAAALPGRSWLAQSGNPCSVTRAVMLSHVLARSLKLALSVERCVSADVETAACMTECASNLLELCKTITIACSNEISSGQQGLEPGAFLGSANLVQSVAKLSGHVARESLIRGCMGKDDAIQWTARFMHHRSRDIRGVAFVNAIRLLDVFGSLRAKASSTNFKMRISLATNWDKLWVPAKSVIETEEHESVLVSGLSLGRKIIEEISASSNSNYTAEQHAREIHQRLVELAQYHSCVDVREYALQLLGLCVRICHGDGAMLERWMELVEVACEPQQAPSTRVAACTSIGLSGLGRNVATENAFSDSHVRGYLALISLLEDDSLEVRRCAACVAQGCTGSDAKGGGSSSLDILPSMFLVYSRLRLRHGRSSTLLQHLESHLGLSFADVASLSRIDGIEGGVLHWALQVLPTRDVSSLESSSQEVLLEKASDAEDPANTARLFLPESDNMHREPVLQTQLAAWCARRILLDHADSIVGNKPFSDVSSVCKALATSAGETLRHGGGKSAAGLIGSVCLTPSGFENCYRGIARTAVIAALLQERHKSEGQLVELYNSKPLSSAVDTCRVSLHPALARAATGAEVLLGEFGEQRDRHRAERAVLFLVL